MSRQKVQLKWFKMAALLTIIFTFSLLVAACGETATSNATTAAATTSAAVTTSAAAATTSAAAATTSAAAATTSAAAATTSAAAYHIGCRDHVRRCYYCRRSYHCWRGPDPQYGCDWLG